MYTINNDSAVEIEMWIFKKSLFPLFIKKYEDKYWKININKENFLYEITFFLHLHKIIINWKSYLTIKQKNEWKRKFIIKIKKEYWFSEKKSENYFDDISKIYDEVYKEKITNVSFFNIFKVIFPIMIVLFIIFYFFVYDEIKIYM